MSNDVLHGVEVSVPIVRQLAAPARLTSKATLRALAPAIAVSVTAPWSGEPGSASVTVGALESTVTVTACPFAVLPAPSVATARTS